MQSHARAVVVGAGIAGSSIAYHLAAKGWRDVLVVEQGEPVSGTTSHAPGLVGQLRSDTSLMAMLMTSVALYRRLSHGDTPGFVGEGSLRLASSPARLAELRAQAAHAAAAGLDAYLVGPTEAKALFPLIDITGVDGALHIPGDGSAAAPVLAAALIREARALGVTFVPHTRVTGVEVEGGQVRAVATTAGRVVTDTLVVAAGIWSPLVGALAGVAVPLTPLQHQYVVTDTLPGLAGRTVPNLRDPDHLFYLRQRDQSLVIGGYERPARPFDPEDIPAAANPTVRAFDAAQFEPVRRGAALRIPALAGAGFARTVNGLEAFTPDGRFLLGPAPRVRGFWTACGFCAHGVSAAGGVGELMANWIADGDPGLDVRHMALDRFGDAPPDRAAIRAGASQVYGSYYDLVR